MSPEWSYDTIRKNIKGIAGIIIEIAYYILAIILLVYFGIFLFSKFPIIYAPLCTVQVGYLLASFLLILGLLGLWLENASLFQQQAFKLLVWSGILVFILTFGFSIAMDIIKIIKDKN